MYEVLISGGTVVDGSGRPGFEADVALSGGRIAAIGEDLGPARTVLDATGLIVCPGFIDVHTHYDAQVLWDPTLSPSPLHGVTTVVAGNCGISLAPLDRSTSDFLVGLLSRVEAIPLEALEAGLEFRWETFAQYLAQVRGCAPAINIGFLAGHSAIRRLVMGPAASERPASESEVSAMADRLGEAIAAGAMGFSSATASTHRDGSGVPTPPTFADRRELVALAAVCGNFPGTSVEFIPESAAYGFTDEDYGLLTAMSVASGRAVNWNTVLLDYPAIPDIHQRQLESADVAAAAGGVVVPMMIPHNFRVRTDFAESDVGFRSLPAFEGLFDLTPPDRLRALSDPTVRRHLHESLAHAPLGSTAMFRDALADHVVSDSGAPALQGVVGRPVAELAHERGQSVLDVMMDLAVTSELDVGFVRHLVPTATAEQRATRAQVLRDPRVVLGASDGGAHVRGVVNVEYTTASFAELVRTTPVFRSEELVHEFTEVPARLYGLVDRGRLQPGFHADIVLFDPDRIGASPVALANDLPGGATRLVSRGEGIESVLVAGVVVVHTGQYPGRRPGRVLHSGTDSVSGGPFHRDRPGAAVR
ncbi:MAG: amidohydrolase family protein [Acidimicrobiales bacterium]